MDNFQKIVLGIATIVLIIILITVGMLINKDNTNTVFPPHADKCPDYWTEQKTETDGKIVTKCNPHTINSGESNQFSSPLNFDDPESNEYFNKYQNGDSAGQAIYTGLSDICAKKKWANENKVIWDGISNYNAC